MKTTKRLIMGFSSSLLLAAGFVRAADRLDPVVPEASKDNPLGVADNCTVPTWAIGDGS